MSRQLLAALFFTACTGGSGVTKFNTPPEALIVSHTDGSQINESYEVGFLGEVSDVDNATDTLLVTWYSGDRVLCEETTASADGTTSCFFVPTLEDTAVRLEVFDPEGASSVAKVVLSVLPTQSPEVHITAPTGSGVYYSDQPLTFSGTVTDAEDDNDALVARWESSVDGELIDVPAVPDETGAVESDGFLTEGEHAITLYATDSTDKTGWASVILTVGPPNTAPNCAFTAPPAGAVSVPGETVIFEGTATDPDIPANWLAVSWNSDVDGALGTSIPASGGGVVFPLAGLSVGTHTIAMTATDEVGASCTANLEHTVGTPPALTLTQPTTGDIINEGSPVSFSATVSDGEDAPTDLSLEWRSSLDGLFSTTGADGSGVAAFSEGGLSLGVHTVTVTATDTDGQFARALVSFRVNGLPLAPDISLAPDPAYTSDFLELSILTPSADPDADPVSYTFAWTQNGGASTASTSATLPPSATKKGDIWAVTVTPNDGYGDGDPATTRVTIYNSAPELASVTLTPPSPVEASTLTCTPGVATDVDGDGVSFSYAWTVAGSAIAATSNTLTGTHFDKGDIVTCTVTPTDGADAGTAILSNPVTIGNSIPSVSGLSIRPDPATAGDTLTCAWTTFTDADLDPDQSTIAWTLGSTTVGTGDTLTGGFKGGDTLTCTVTPYDGEDTGTPVATSLTIDNSAPELASVTLTPPSPVKASTLTCTPGVATDVDGDGVSFSYAWTVAGSGIAATTNTLTGANFDKGDTVTCTVTPTDGTAAGTAIVSNPVTIGNIKPVITSVTLSPTKAYTKTKLKATVIASDADPGDSLTYTYTWFNGTTKLAAIGSELDGLTWFEKGDVISVEVVANDGYDDSSTVKSGSVTISNTIPRVSGVSITPDPAYAKDTLTCAWATFEDADTGDTDLSTVVWKRGGATLGTGKTLTGGFKGGDNISCTVTAYDGEDMGPSVTANLVITNSVPVLSSVSLTPTSATEKTTLTCTPGAATDADGDTIGYNFAWTVSGVSIAKTSHTLIGDFFSKGDTVMCTVTPRDGKGPGLPVDSNTVTIGNTPPTTPTVVINPTGPEAGVDDLICKPTSADVDLTDTISYTFSWSVLRAPSTTSVPYTGTTSTTFFAGDTLPAAGLTAAGDIWTCTVVATDGTDSTPAVSATRTIICVPRWETLDGQDENCNGKVDDLRLSQSEQRASGGLPGHGNGTRIASAGDVNDDGYEDVLVGTGYLDIYFSLPGTTYLLLGSATGLTTTSLSTADAVLTGEASYDWAGVVSSAGDIDGDGYDDVLIGAPGVDAPGSAGGSSGNRCGAAYVVLGSSSGIADMNLSSADAKLVCETNGDWAGKSVATAGDVNDDGYDDILVAAYGQTSQNGVVYLVLGSSSGISDMSLKDADLKWTGENARDQASLPNAAGDTNGDGYDDVIIGAQDEDAGGVNAGAAYLLLGGCDGSTTCGGTKSGFFTSVSSGSMSLADADAKLTGEAAGDDAGRTVSGAGDVDNDGYDDVMVGAPNHDGNKGAVYLLYGSSVGITDMGLKDADAQILGDSYAGRDIGHGDVNGDGYSDIFVSNTSTTGSVVILGSSGGIADMTMSDADATVSENYPVFGANAHADVNGDGYDDLLFGKSTGDASGTTISQLDLFFGSSF